MVRAMLICNVGIIYNIKFSLLSCVNAAINNLFSFNCVRLVEYNVWFCKIGISKDIIFI